MRNKKHFLIGLALIGILFSSCADKNKKQSEDRVKEELVLAIVGEPDDGFDPTRGWGEYGSPLFQSTLLYYDSEFEVKKDLATKYSTSEDGLEWTIALRDDVKFSDGTPLTVDDVIFTYETTKNSHSSIDLTNVKEIVRLDDKTFKFILKKRNSTFLFYLTNIGIVPKHAYDASYAENPIGSGPFELVQWDKGQQMILKANPHYYNEAPFFKKLSFLFLSEDAAFAAAKAGQVDIAAIPPAFGKTKVHGMRLKEVESIDNRGVDLIMLPEEGKTNEGNPIGNDVTSDIAIRKAMNVGVDRQALVDGVLNGFGTPAYTAIDNMPWWNPETVFEDKDIEQAIRILEEAGWVLNKEGIREKNGVKAILSLYYPSNDKTRQSLSIAFADMMQPLGIQMTAIGRSWSELAKVMNAHPVMFGYGNHTPLAVFNSYSSTTQGQGLSNPNYYSNPKVDAYFSEALQAPTQEKAYEYWKKAQWDGETGFTFKGDASWVWLVNLKHLYIMDENLDIGKQKIQPHGHGWPITDNIQEWRWKE